MQLLHLKFQFPPMCWILFTCSCRLWLHPRALHNNGYYTHLRQPMHRHIRIGCGKMRKRCDANGRVEAKFKELRFMVSNLVLKVAHMETQLAVVPTPVATQPYIGNVAATAPMKFELIHKNAYHNWHEPRQWMKTTQCNGELHEFELKTYPWRPSWRAIEFVSHWHCTIFGWPMWIHSNGSKNCKFVAMRCVTQIMCNVVGIMGSGWNGSFTCCMCSIPLSDIFAFLWMHHGMQLSQRLRSQWLGKQCLWMCFVCNHQLQIARGSKKLCFGLIDIFDGWYRAFVIRSYLKSLMSLLQITLTWKNIRFDQFNFASIIGTSRGRHVSSMARDHHDIHTWRVSLSRSVWAWRFRLVPKVLFAFVPAHTCGASRMVSHVYMTRMFWIVLRWQTRVLSTNQMTRPTCLGMDPNLPPRIPPQFGCLTIKVAWRPYIVCNDGVVWMLGGHEVPQGKEPTDGLANCVCGGFVFLVSMQWVVGWIRARSIAICWCVVVSCCCLAFNKRHHLRNCAQYCLCCCAIKVFGWGEGFYCYRVCWLLPRLQGDGATVDDWLSGLLGAYVRMRLHDCRFIVLIALVISRANFAI